RGNAPAGGGQRSENSIPREWRIVVGNHAIKETLSVRPRAVKGLWLKNGWESSADLREIEELAAKYRVKIETRQETVIDKFGSSHQGAALFADAAPQLDLDGLEKHNTSVVLMLDGIEDPHNLGAILRTSWLTGGHGVLIPQDRAVGLTPTVHKVACGGVEHVPVEETTNFSKYTEILKEKGYWVYGLSPRGKKSIFELDLPEKVIWAIGAEDKGLRVTTERLCDELVFIPQTNASASFNASVATAMALTETLRQHAQRGNRKKSQSDK
ncbi:MAG: 23S rRNA (guanosine(2251)-2'-O)-methyltransferase RlmB, partial [Bacillota bacterium]